MTKPLGRLLLCGAIAMPIGLASVGAVAQTTITPLPDPSVGSAPSAPSGAQQTYDQVSIGQLMKIENLSRQIGGGVSQIYDGEAGPKTFPTFDAASDVTARQGGTGLQAMANAALGGSVTGPTDVVSAFNGFQTAYSLSSAFALQSGSTSSGKFVALASAEGAIAASTAEASYSRANASMTRLENYISALESSPDLKTSVDINTRVMIEIAEQLNELVRTQAALTETAGTYYMIMGAEASQTSSWGDLTKFNR
jgi:hypothetical protein